MTIRSRRVRLVGVLAVTATVAAACAGPGDSPLEIGFRRVALDLAFKDAALAAAPVEPETIIRQFVERDVEYSVEEFTPPPSPREPTVVRQVRVVPRRAQRECPTAPEGQAPDRVAFQTVKEPPTVGRYPRHNEGKLTIEVAARSFDIPVPPLSAWEIAAVSSLQTTPVAGDREAEAAPLPAPVATNTTVMREMTQFELTRRLLPGFSVTDTYRYTNDYKPGGDYLYLVKRVRVTQGKESVFQPSPPIRVVKLNVPEGEFADAGSAHGGVDPETNEALSIQSQIVARELVDVCGEIADTYRVMIKENFVDLSKSQPETSGNEGDSANYWNIQFDNGLLIVREEVNSTFRTTTKVLGQDVPMIVTYDYTSTLDSLVPQPPSGGAAAEPSPSEAPEEDG